MNIRLTTRILGGLTLFVACMLLVPVPIAFIFDDHQGYLFAATAALVAALGWLMARCPVEKQEITYREGFGVVTLGWLTIGIVGAIPYLLTGVLTCPVDALFESMSGFSTTGSTVLTNLSEQPKCVILWRSLSQWLGGMGIIVLGLAILPFLGVGGMQLFEAEVPGPTADRLRPRIRDTAKLLWGVYFLITAVEFVLLWCSDTMNWFEALNHALTTMATGGFSTDDLSVAYFDSSYVHWVITIFMFLAGVNFSLHFHLLRGKPGHYLKSEEFLFYTGLVVTATLFVTVSNWFRYDSAAINLRDAAFQVVSLTTTTGYASADYEQWPLLSQYVLATLLFVGGCAGSTGGGPKIVRILLVFKHAYLQLHRLIHPREIRMLRLDGKPVIPEIMQAILGFVAIYLAIFLLASVALAALMSTGEPYNDLMTADEGTSKVLTEGEQNKTVLTVDEANSKVLTAVHAYNKLLTAGSAVIACLGNVGPGFGLVGPTDNFMAIPWLGKLLLCGCMLVGRLEVFTVLVMFFPSFWRK